MNDRRMDQNRKERILRGLTVLTAGVLAGVMYLLLIRHNAIVPFGDNTWIMLDLKRQYIDYYAYYQRIFSGQEGILYSFETTLGSGMVGFMCYYLANPLFVLLLPFPADRLPLGVSFVIGVTIVLAAMIMAAFLWWYLERNEHAGGFFGRCLPSLAGAMAWSFSGFLIAHSMNPMWTDVWIFIPVLIYALETGFLGEAGEIPLRKLRLYGLRYSLCVALILIWNYYISYQVLLLVALWTLVRLWENKDRHPVRTIARLFVHTVGAVLVDTVLMLPVLIALANSPKDIFRLGMAATGQNLSPVDVFSKAYFLAYDADQTLFGYPQIYIGLFLLCAVVLFFTDGRRRIRERAALLIPVLVYMISFCVDAVNLFWHALMEPSGHPYRQAPEFVFIVILAGCRYLSGLRGKNACDADTDAEGEKWSRMIPRYLVTAGCLLGMLFLVGRGNYYYTTQEMLRINAVRIPLILAALFVCELLPRGAGIRRQVLPLVLILAMLIYDSSELTDNACFTQNIINYSGETRNHFLETVDAVKTQVDAVYAMDPGFYRMEQLTPREQNDGMMYGYNGVTHYSSAGMTYVRYLLHKLGFNDDGLYTHYGHDNTVTMDMLLGIRYLLTTDRSLVHPAYQPVETGADTGVYVYRNPYALSVALEVPDYDLNGITGIDNPYSLPQDPFALQEDMLSRLAGEQVRVFAGAETETEEVAEGEEKKVLVAHITPVLDGELYMYLDGLMGTIQGLAVFEEDELLTGYGNRGCYKILNLGTRRAGETLTVKIEGESGDPDFGRPLFVTEDTEAVAAVFARLEGYGITVREDGNDGIAMDLPADCGDIVTSIPYEEGWSVPGIRTYGAMMVIPGEQAASRARDGLLRMHFIPAGMKTGAAVSLIVLLLCGLWLYFGVIRLKEDEERNA